MLVLCLACAVLATTWWPLYATSTGHGHGAASRLWWWGTHADLRGWVLCLYLVLWPPRLALARGWADFTVA